MNTPKALHGKAFGVVHLIAVAVATGIGCGGGAILALLLVRTVLCRIWT